MKSIIQNKKAITSIAIVLLLLMTLIIYIYTLYIFIVERNKFSTTIKTGIVSDVYAIEEQIRHNLNNGMKIEDIIKNFNDESTKITLQNKEVIIEKTYEKIRITYKFEPEKVTPIITQKEEIQKVNLIFIPVNWNFNQQEFNNAITLQYNYFISLVGESKRKDSGKLVYFDNLNYVFGGGVDAVELVEGKIKENFPSYNKDKDIIIALIPEMHEPDSLGQLWGQQNIILVKYDSVSTLAHELGHAIWGFCDEYTYLIVKCGDEKKNFEAKFRQEIITNPKEYFIPRRKLEYRGLNFEQFYNEIDKSGKFTNEFLENLAECSVEGGWLFQNYVNPKKDVLSCPNSYPTCCVDSPYYLGDNNKEGVNCNPGISKKEDASRLCAGSPCGKNCRSIMGIEVQGVINAYPL